MDKREIKENFGKLLKKFTKELGNYISKDDEWTIKGFIDIFKIFTLYQMIQKLYLKY